MRILLASLVFLAACDTGPTVSAQSPANSAAPAALASYVRANFASLIDDIEVGGGPDLNAVLDIANVPSEDRMAVGFALNDELDVFRGNPDALITRLADYGS